MLHIVAQKACSTSTSRRRLLQTIASPVVVPLIVRHPELQQSLRDGFSFRSEHSASQQQALARNARLDERLSARCADAKERPFDLSWREGQQAALTRGALTGVSGDHGCSSPFDN